MKRAVQTADKIVAKMPGQDVEIIKELRLSERVSETKGGNLF